MNPEIQRLLALLDDEQALWEYVREHYGLDAAVHCGDFAFRMRDEAAVHIVEWDNACRIVLAKLTTPGAAARYSPTELESWVLWRSPAVWIITALIAQQLQNEQG